jgi:hypothetical protein
MSNYENIINITIIFLLVVIIFLMISTIIIDKENNRLMKTFIGLKNDRIKNENNTAS